MRIGQFLSHFPAPGGTSRMVSGLSEALVLRGHHVVVYGHGNPEVGGDVTPFEIRTFRGARPSLPVRLNGHTPVTEWIRANRDALDVCVIHGVFDPTSPGVAAACDGAGIPYIACPHDPYSSALFQSHRLRKELFWRAYEAPFLRVAAGVHVLAPSHAHLLSTRGISTPAFVAPNGVKLPPLRRRLLDHPRDDVILTYVGRWDVFNKGLDLLLQAIEMTPDLRSHFELRIAGHGSRAQSTTLQQIIVSDGLESVVSLLGYVPNIDEHIQSADIVVLPSRFDGFGQVVTEALALGTPVVVSLEAGAAEYFGEKDGVVTMEPHPAAISEALLRARSKLPDLRRAAATSRDRLNREFSWPAVAERWEAGVAALGIAR